MKLSLPYSDKLKQILSYSREEAMRLHNMSIEPEHLMLGIIRDGENHAFRILQNELLLNVQEYKHNLEDNLKQYAMSTETADNIVVSEETSNILRLGLLEAKLLKSDSIKSEHVLLGLMKHKSIPAMQFLNKNGISYNSVLATLQPKPTTPKADIDFDDEEEDDAPPSSRKSKSTAKASDNKQKLSDTPAIDSFGVDITRAALEGKLDPVVGREKEIERIAQILSRRKKNNPVLIGEPGVGKSAIVEGLALRIINRKVSRILFDKRIISLDMSTVVAGTKYRGQFEERMRAIINELKENPNIIIFIDAIKQGKWMLPT